MYTKRWTFSDDCVERLPIFLIWGLGPQRQGIMLAFGVRAETLIYPPREAIIVFNTT